MQLDFADLSPLEAYRWLASSVTPRPIAWVSTRSTDGVANLAPFSFFQVISDNPPTLLVNINTRDDGSLKDSLRNAQASGEHTGIPASRSPPAACAGRASSAICKASSTHS